MYKTPLFCFALKQRDEREKQIEKEIRLPK